MSTALFGFVLGVAVGCGFAWATLTIVGVLLTGVPWTGWTRLLRVEPFVWFVWFGSGVVAAALHYLLFIRDFGEPFDEAENAADDDEGPEQAERAQTEPEAARVDPEVAQRKTRAAKPRAPRRKSAEQEVKDRVRGILVRVKSVAQLNVECQKLKEAYAADQHPLIDRLFRQEIEAVREQGVESR